MSAKWAHKDVWTRSGRTFCVEVSRWSDDASRLSGYGLNRWCVYAHIFTLHPCYAHFSGHNLWQDAATNMPGHGGPTLLRYNLGDNGKGVGVTVGWDYMHCGDEKFSNMQTADEAREVFRDAEELFEYLRIEGEIQWTA